MNGTESTKSSKRFYNNPVFGFIGSIAGVIGIVFYIISRTSPDLVYLSIQQKLRLFERIRALRSALR